MPAPRKRKVHTRQGIQGRRPRAFFLPMPREDADVLILRTRMMLERVRNGEVDRALVANLGQVVLLVNFVIAAGYGALEPSLVDDVEQQLGLVLLRADQTGEWLVPPGLADDLTRVVNEYDRQLRETRLEIIAKASGQVERLRKAARATGERSG